jgi:hypothetical protein
MQSSTAHFLDSGAFKTKIGKNTVELTLVELGK